MCIYKIFYSAEQLVNFFVGADCYTNEFIYFTIFPNILFGVSKFCCTDYGKNNNSLQLFGVLNCYNNERTFQRGGEMMTEEKFIHAVKRNSRRLFVIAFSYLKNKHDAEDALQNVFLKLWKSKIEFNDDLGIDKWLTKVLVNDCKNFFNLSFRQNKSIEEVYDVSTFDKYFNVDLYNAVMSLNKKERLCVILFYYDDLTISDISKVTGIKESTVKSLLKRSRNKLKLMLGDEWIYEQ